MSGYTISLAYASSQFNTSKMVFKDQKQCDDYLDTIMERYRDIKDYRIHATSSNPTHSFTDGRLRVIPLL